MQRPGPFGAILAIDHADRHHGPVARLDRQPFGGIKRGIVTAGDFLLLEQFEPRIGEVIVIDRIRRDHALINEPQLVDIVFGIVRQPGRIARFGEGDRRDLRRVGVGTHLNLVEPVQPPLGDVEVLVEFETGQVELVRSGNERFPLARRIEVGRCKAEIDMFVIGVDVEFAVANIDIVFDAFDARLDQYLLAGRIVCAHQPHFACLVVAGGDDQPVFLRRKSCPDPETLVFFLVKRRIAFNRGADDVQLRLQRPPLLGRRTIDQRCVLRDPGQAAAKVGQLVRQQLTGLKVLDPRGVAFRTIVIRRIGKEPAIVRDRKRPEPEIVLSLGQFVLIEDQRLVATSGGASIPFAIFLPLVEFRPVDPVTIFLRDRGIVLLHTALQLFIDRVDQPLLRRHPRLEPRIFRLDVIEYILVIDHRIGLVLEPVIGIRNGDAVVGIAMLALFRDGRGSRGVFGQFHILRANIVLCRQRLGCKHCDKRNRGDLCEFHAGYPCRLAGSGAI